MCSSHCGSCFLHPSSSHQKGGRRMLRLSGSFFVPILSRKEIGLSFLSPGKKSLLKNVFLFPLERFFVRGKICLLQNHFWRRKKFFSLLHLARFLLQKFFSLLHISQRFLLWYVSWICPMPASANSLGILSSFDFWFLSGVRFQVCIVFG